MRTSRNHKPTKFYEVHGSARAGTLDSAIQRVFELASLTGRRDPAELARALLVLENRLEVAFGLNRHRRATRPLLFTLAEKAAVHLQRRNSDEFAQFVIRLFRLVANDTGLLYTIQTAILAMTARSVGSKQAYKLNTCELDAALYLDYATHPNGFLELSPSPQAAYVEPLLSRSSFSPISCRSNSRAKAKYLAANLKSLLECHPEFEAKELVLTCPDSPTAWTDYAARRAAKDYSRRLELFVRRLRKLGMKKLIVGRDVAFRGHGLHVHFHALYVGLPISPEMIRRAWDEACWPHGRPESQQNQTISTCTTLHAAGWPITRSVKARLIDRTAYIIKGLHAPTEWTESALRRWAEFVADVRRHPRAFSTFKGPGTVSLARKYARRKAKEQAERYAAQVPCVCASVTFATGDASAESAVDYAPSAPSSGSRVSLGFYPHSAEQSAATPSEVSPLPCSALFSEGAGEFISLGLPELPVLPATTDAPDIQLEVDRWIREQVCANSSPLFSVALKMQVVGTLGDLLAFGRLHCDERIDEPAAIRLVLKEVLDTYNDALFRRRQRLIEKGLEVPELPSDIFATETPRRSGDQRRRIWDAQTRRRLREIELLRGPKKRPRVPRAKAEGANGFGEPAEVRNEIAPCNVPLSEHELEPTPMPVESDCDI